MGEGNELSQGTVGCQFAGFFSGDNAGLILDNCALAEIFEFYFGCILEGKMFNSFPRKVEILDCSLGTRIGEFKGPGGVDYDFVSHTKFHFTDAHLT